MIERGFFSGFTIGTLLEKIGARLIYLNEIYLLRTRLFRRPSGRQNAFVRPVHLTEPAREENRRKQSRGGFHPGVARSRRSRRGCGRHRKPDWRESDRAI